jgi:hypothetical protein
MSRNCEVVWVRATKQIVYLLLANNRQRSVYILLITNFRDADLYGAYEWSTSIVCWLLFVLDQISCQSFGHSRAYHRLVGIKLKSNFSYPDAWGWRAAEYYFLHSRMRSFTHYVQNSRSTIAVTYPNLDDSLVRCCGICSNIFAYLWNLLKFKIFLTSKFAWI